jgi:hypothetical protein
MSNEPSSASIAALRGEFSCAATEIGFLHAQSAAILRDLRRGLLLCSLFYMVFGVSDIAALGVERAIVPLLSRLAIPSWRPPACTTPAVRMRRCARPAMRRPLSRCAGRPAIS